MATGKIISTVAYFEENDDASAMNIAQMKARLGELFQRQVETANEVESLTHRIFAAMETQKNTAVNQQQNIDHQNFDPLNPPLPQFTSSPNTDSDEELGLTVDKAEQHHKENNDGEEKSEEEQRQKEIKMENIIIEGEPSVTAANKLMELPESPHFSPSKEKQQQQNGEEVEVKHIPHEALDLNETTPIGEQEKLSLTPLNNKQSLGSSFVPSAMDVTDEKNVTTNLEKEQRQKKETKIENIVFEEGEQAVAVMESPESPSSPSEEEQQQDGEEEEVKHIPLDLNETIPMGEQEEFLSLTPLNNNKQSADSFESLSSFVPPAMNVTDEKKSGMDDDDAAATPSKQESVMNNTGLEPVNPDEERAISKNSNGSTFAVQTESEPELKAARPEMQLALASPLLSESGGSLTSNGTSEPVAIDPNAAPNTIKVSFSLRRLFAEKTLRSAHKEMAGYRWSMSIQFVKDSLKEGADEEGGIKRVPLSLGLFLHCMGPIDPGLPAGTVHVKQPWFYIHNWAGKMGMRKRAPMSMHFKPPYAAPRGVWFNLEAKQELIERGLITADQLNIKVSVEVEFQTPSEASIGGSPVKQEG